MAVSHPNSPDYSIHWTLADLVETFAPSTETIDAVTNYLVGSGIARDRLRLSLNKAWINFNARAAEVEGLLNTEYYVFTHSSGNKQISCSSYSVPAHIQDHIDLIMPTVHFTRGPTTAMAQRNRSGGLGSPDVKMGPIRLDKGITFQDLPLLDCDGAITLDCLRKLNGIDYNPPQRTNTTFGIVEFTPQSYLPLDLDVFFSLFAYKLIGSRPKFVSIAGGTLPYYAVGPQYNIESDLDLEYAIGLVHPQNVTLLQTGDDFKGGSFNTWLDAVDGDYCSIEGGDDPEYDPMYPSSEVCGTAAVPQVISISYCSNEVDVSPKYAERQCREYAKLGVMGSSVFYSSGDSGVAGNGGVCVNGTVFTPSFPGGCPYVTSVGATQINSGSSLGDPESACERIIYSGGGFSNHFSKPKYQAKNVDHYLSTYTPQYTGEQFNNSMKAPGFPDVSANGANYVVVVKGLPSLVYGTSASSPVFASMISMINDARISKGKSTVGFINHAIYSKEFESAFNDITTGKNPGCGTPGFSATKGWDPVTGLGTPKFKKLLEMFVNLP